MVSCYGSNRKQIEASILFYQKKKKKDAKVTLEQCSLIELCTKM